MDERCGYGRKISSYIDELAVFSDKLREIDLHAVKILTSLEYRWFNSLPAYRETVDKARAMVDKGCDVVEMECASIMAMSKLRGIKSYQFLYCDDTLESEEWNMRTMKDNRSSILSECLKIALNVASKI